MFGDTLLESSSAPRKGKRWPMATTAFTAEAIIGGLLVIVPLLSTGVIPISARVPLYGPVKPVMLETMERVPANRTPATGPATSAPRSTAVVLVSNNPNAIYHGPAVDTTTDPTEVRPPGSMIGTSTRLSDFMTEGPVTPNVRLGPKRIVSQYAEAQLVNRVEPVYPHLAVVSGIQGQVKLHAIIARDGSIQSLNAISGHPLLVRAALAAVEQWRYRPYVLNGETVEVETLITVNFKRDAH
jgi:protein TonB